MPLGFNKVTPDYITTSPGGSPPVAGETTVQDLYASMPPAEGATASTAVTRDASATLAAGPNTNRSAVDASAAAADASRASAAGTSSTGYNAQTGEIDPETMSAAGQLGKITGTDSPLMRRARQEGLLTAGRRGLENSSIAAGNAMGAMADRATPLAQQDAATYYQNMRANLDATNRAAEVSTGRETDASFLTAQLQTDVAQANAKAENDIAMLNAQLETAVSQQNASEQNRIEAQIADLQNQVNIRNAELLTQTNLANSSEANRASMLNAEIETQNAQFVAQQRNDMAIEVSRQITELNKQWMQGEQQVDLAEVQGRYQQLISSNAAAGVMFDGYLNGLAQIMQNPEIKPDRIAEYVNIMSSQLEGGLEFIDAINSLDAGYFTDMPGAYSTGTGATARVNPLEPTPPPDPTAPVAPSTQPAENTLGDAAIYPDYSDYNYWGNF